MVTAMVPALVKREEEKPRGLQITTMSDLSAFGKMLASSGYFRDARDAAQACVKVQAGIELGIPPVQAMTGIHIVEGKPTLSATLIATLIKRSGKYNYRIKKHDDNECSIQFTEGREEIGVSSFTMKDAELAGLAGKGVWKSYRRNMLFSRAMSNGARWYCPDVFGGAIYTPEEFSSVEVNGDGEVVHGVETHAGETLGETEERVVAKKSAARQAVEDTKEIMREAGVDPNAFNEKSTKDIEQRRARGFAWAVAYLDKLDAAAKLPAEPTDDDRTGALEAFKTCVDENANAAAALVIVDTPLRDTVKTYALVLEAHLHGLEYSLNDHERVLMANLHKLRGPTPAPTTTPAQ